MAPAVRSPTRLDRRTRAARAEGQDARAALLEAAAEVVMRRGLRDASIDEIADRAGYSKGAVYWHFAGKDELFLAVLEERVDRPLREMIELLETAPPEQDMSIEANRRLVEFLEGERSLLLLDREYWARAARDPKLRARYAERQAKLRAALTKALVARAEHLGHPEIAQAAERMATAFMGLATGLAQEKLIDPNAVPDDLLGETIVLVYAGLVARYDRPGPGSPTG